MFPKTPVATTSRKQAFRDENAILPGKTMDANKPVLKNKQFVTPTQQTSRRVPLGGKDTNVHNVLSGGKKTAQFQTVKQQQPLKEKEQQPLSERRSAGGRSSMRASARKRLQVRSDNAGPIAETEHVGLPQHLWKTTEIETMPPPQTPAEDINNDWVFDNSDDDILGNTDIAAPATKRNSLDLDWDALNSFEPLPEVPTAAPKRLAKPVVKPKTASSFPSLPSKPIAKPFSRRPARAMVPLKSQNPTQSAAAPKTHTDRVLNTAKESAHTPVRRTPSRIPIRSSTPNQSAAGATTPLRSHTPRDSRDSPRHGFMNPTKSAEAKMRVRVDSPRVEGSPRPSRSIPNLRHEGLVSRPASTDVAEPVRPATADADCARPTTADSNWSTSTDPIDRFSFEEDFEL